MAVNVRVLVVNFSGRCEAEACSDSEKLQREPPTVKRLSLSCSHWVSL